MSNEPLTAVLAELPRDQAKSFFTTKGDEAVLAFVQELLKNNETNVLSVGNAWKELALSFGDQPPMAWCFTAGRAMYGGSDYAISLIRPDMVAHIATYLADTEFSKLAAETHFELLQGMRTHFETAAKAGSAMIFAVEN